MAVSGGSGGASLVTIILYGPTGWTLLVTATTNTWSTTSILSRNNVSMSSDFSFLKYATRITVKIEMDAAAPSAHDFIFIPTQESEVVSGTRFQYRLEAGDRGRYGGIFSAPRHYPFTSNSNFLTDVTLEEAFDTWTFADDGIEKRCVMVDLSWRNGS